MFRRRAGFTLVELLIVVAIIGILAAIAIPQFSRYKVKSQITMLNADLKNAFIAAQGYFTEHDMITVSDEGSLLRHGFKRSAGIEVVSIDLRVNSGEIILRHSNLDASIVTTKEGKVTFDGKFVLPAFR